MLKYDRNERSPKLIKFFRNILTFVQTFLTHKREIRKLYNDIRNGKYKGAKIDPLSANEFKHEYPEGKPFEIPGVSQNKQGNLRVYKIIKHIMLQPNLLQTL